MSSENPFATSPGGQPTGAANPFDSSAPQPQPVSPQAAQPNGAFSNGSGTIAPPPDVPQAVIDPNDPRLLSEEQNLDPKGDAYAVAPLPPEGRYKAKLKLIGVDDDKKYQGHNFQLTATKKDNLPYFSTGIGATIIDPSGTYDGITVYPEFGGEVGTLVAGKMTASKVSSIVGKLGNGPNGQPWYPTGRMTQLAWMVYFVEKVLPSEPGIGIEIQWQASCPACGTAVKEAKNAGQAASYAPTIKGMMSFPPERDPEKIKKGQRNSPNLNCQKHGTYRGRAVLVGFLGLDEVK